jgi:mannose-6-phosphate isomerase-like protein (cupin superfamily)
MDQPRNPLPSWLPAPGESAGLFEGAAHGAEVSFCVVDAAADEGPTLHSHPYSETFLIQRGSARFEIDGREIEAGAGEVVVVAAGTVHAFRALGPGRLQLVAIHASPRVQSSWFEDAPLRRLSADRR